MLRFFSLPEQTKLFSAMDMLRMLTLFLVASILASASAGLATRVDANVPQIVPGPLALVNATSGSIPCHVCSFVVGHLESYIVKHGCGLLLKLRVAAACEAAGLGPEEPGSEACIAVIIASCEIIANEVKAHITSPTTICGKIHMC
jgi:hypothetical protein